MRLTFVMVALARTSWGFFNCMVREESAWIKFWWGKGELGKGEMNGE